MTVKKKLTLTMVLVLLVVIAILGGIYLTSMRSSLFAREYESTAEKSREAANVIAQLFEAQQNSLSSAAEFLALDARPLDNRIATLQYSLGLSNFEYYAIKWHSDWHYVSRSGHDFREPMATYPGLSGRVVYDKLYEDDMPGLLFIQSIHDLDGNEIGRMIAKLSAEDFFESIRSIGSRVNADMIISRHSGSILYPSFYAGGLLAPAAEGSAKIEIGFKEDVARQTGMTMPVANSSLDVTVIVNNEEIDAEYRQIVAVFLVVAALALAVTGSFVYFASSRMTRSVSDLAVYVAQMGADCDSCPAGSRTAVTKRAGSRIRSHSCWPGSVRQRPRRIISRATTA